MVRLLCLLGCWLLPSLLTAADAGALPLGADGKPLNLDFETGTLKDWTLEGEAFSQQPVRGDTVAPRRGDAKSRHQGEYWLGGYERLGDKPQGTLRSAAFTVTQPWGSFLVGGGPHKETCVELVRADTNQVVFAASGREREDLERVAVDLRALQGKQVFIRVVDRHSGHWGHVNFDDFRLHAGRPEVAERPAPLTADDYPHRGLKPLDAAAKMRVPEGFRVSLLAGEPDVHQPIAMCTDDRGRLWVVECDVYPRRKPEPGPLLKDPTKGDRIVIFEDADNDGRFDRRTVFLSGLNLASAIEYGHGGIWVGAAPYLLFIPVDPSGDAPAGEPRVVLDGWGYQDTHEMLNSFIWGPDGWLYGCHGVFTHSRVGKPGTPDEKRVPLNAGVWRYHPTRQVFEVVAHGTSNPWGLDYNAVGDWFIEACVIPHNWHVIPGGRYQRQAGQHFNPFTFDDIKTIAEHRHYLGDTPHGGNGKSDSAGGGHAHSGTLIYQGGTWPREYHGKMLMGNIHGHRVNVDTLTPQGSGYRASRHPDFLTTGDQASLLVAIHPAPDGNVFLLDWYDVQSCHRTDPDVWDRTTGRIYKVSHGPNAPPTGDLARLETAALLKLLASDNVWQARHALRILQERRVELKLNPAAEPLLKHADPRVRLRTLWLQGSDESTPLDAFVRHFEDADAHLRRWAVEFILQRVPNPEGDLLGRLLSLAKDDPSPVVRRALASGLQRLDTPARWPLAQALLAHAEDASDHNLPLLLWYGIEPLAGADAARAMELALAGKFPLLVEFTARRVAAGRDAAQLEQLLAVIDAQLDRQPQWVLARALKGLVDGFQGLRQVKAPRDWGALAPKLLAKGTSREVRDHADRLALFFGDPRKLAELRTLAADPAAPLDARRAAVQTLLEQRDPQLPATLRALLDEPTLRPQALRGLAQYDDPQTAAKIIALWPKLGAGERRDAATTLASRARDAQELLKAVEARQIPAGEVPSDVVRLIRALPEPKLAEQLARVWGSVRETPAERQRLIQQWRGKLTAASAAKPDLHLGRAVFQKTCGTCHVLYGVGGQVGPEITGANRGSLDYLLENIFDPSAVIPLEYTMSTLALGSGQTLQGIIQGEANGVLTVQTATERLRLPRTEVDSIRRSEQSMMPEDVLKPLSEPEIRALFAYLQSPAQVPMLATAENAKEFFNGTDLKFWDGDPKLWRVEKGEIVGSTDGLKKNQFLKSQFNAEDFKLTLEVKLTPNSENSGIQFRSEPLPDGEMKGYQADIGAGWWGKLYEESARGLLWKEPGDKHVKEGDWNEYVIIARGSKIQTFLNGQKCVDLDDPAGARRGTFALQLHSGGKMEVRFRKLSLEVLK